MNFTANALLSVGAVPVMSSCRQEMDELVQQSDGLLINIGCVTDAQLDAMCAAVRVAKRYHKPWVLDPVGWQMTAYRRSACQQLLSIASPTLLKGNQREIGDDAAAHRLAHEYGCVVVRTGATDLITDGATDRYVTVGHPLMPRVTATGCVAGALCAAYAATNSNAMQAAEEALTLMGTAGQAAAERCHGTGTFITFFLDELYQRTIGPIHGDR